jgi:tRNA(Ile)-lysidine synthase
MAGSRTAKPSDLAGLIAARLAPYREQRLCVALSGGADSVALLHLAARVRSDCDFTLAALHVNHGISPNADHWQAFCADLCARLDIPLRSARVRLDPASKLGLEAEARACRYAEYRREPADWLLLAQHQDDQAETLLLQLLRGAGPRGLAAMAARAAPRPGEPGLLRPLLDVPRATLDAYLRDAGLAWVEDESNLDPDRARNFLRHDILPRLARHFPAWRDTLARAASHQGETARMLDELGRLDRGADAGVLEVSTLLGLSDERARNALRGLIADAGLRPPNSARLAAFLTQACHAAPDRSPLLAWPEGRLRVWRNRVYCLPAQEPPVPPAPLPWRGEPGLPWAGGEVRFAWTTGTGIARARLEGAAVELRSRQGGERFRPDRARPTRSLAALWQEHEVPPWERARMPLLFRADALLWAPGLGVACDWQAGADEAGIAPDWVKPPMG